MKAWTEFILRHARAVVILAVLLSVIGTYFSVLLYKNLRPDLEEMLPVTARSVRDLNEVSERLQSINSFAVLIFSDQPKQARDL